MRRPQVPVQPEPIEYFGALKPAGVIGATGFQKHEATSSWDDDGRAEQLAADITAALQGLAGALKGYGAEQARDAVYDYVSNSYLDMAMVDGHASIVFDVSNEAAQLRVHWGLDELLSRVIQDALDKERYDIIDSIHQVTERTSLMLTSMQQGQGEPEPAPIPNGKHGRIAATRVAAPRTTAALPQVRRTAR